MRHQFMISIEFITADATAASDQVLGAWLRLCTYSAPRLLGGRLEGAKAWDAATWLRATGVARKAVDGLVVAGLAAWSGDDLVLHGYDLHGEKVWRAKSKGGTEGNKRRWSTPLPAVKEIRTPTSESDIGIRDRNDDRTPNRRSAALRSDSESAAAAAAAAADPPTPDDPRLIAAAAAGAYPDFEGKDLRTEWLAAFGDDTVEQVAEVMAAGRRRTGKPIRMPSSYVAQSGHMREAQQEAARLERERAETEARRAQERQKNLKAEADAARWRHMAGGLLAAHDEDPATWAAVLTPSQAKAMAEIREAHAAGRPLGLVMVRHFDSLPVTLQNLAASRGREIAETNEGPTP